MNVLIPLLDGLLLRLHVVAAIVQVTLQGHHSGDLGLPFLPELRFVGLGSGVEVVLAHGGV